jgi:hypothetical protein
MQLSHALLKGIAFDIATCSYVIPYCTLTVDARQYNSEGLTNKQFKTIELVMDFMEL